MSDNRLRNWGRYAVLGLLVVLAVAGLFYSEVTDRVVLEAALQPPSPSHWMGTDELGRDIFARALRGTSLSLILSLLAWATALIVGLILGTVAGYFASSPVDRVISWLIALAYVTPLVIMLVGLLSVIGPGLANAYIVLTLFAWVAPARQTRASVKNLRAAQHVVAARSFGFSSNRIFQFVIIPQIYKPVLIASLAILPEIIALDAGLSFFGLGAQPPIPTLGKMIVDGVGYLSVAWWMSLFPILILSIICLGVRFLAELLSTRAADDLSYHQPF